MPVFKGEYTSKQDLHNKLARLLLSQFKSKGLPAYDLNTFIGDGITLIDSELVVLEVKSKKSFSGRKKFKQLQNFRGIILVYEQTPTGVRYHIEEIPKGN